LGAQRYDEFSDLKQVFDPKAVKKGRKGARRKTVRVNSEWSIVNTSIAGFALFASFAGKAGGLGVGGISSS
jgi:hypothetical protein